VCSEIQGSYRPDGDTLHIAAIAIAVLCGLGGYIYIFKSIQDQLNMQHDINLKLPPDRQFEPTFWNLGTWGKFRELQAELLPGDPRARRLLRFQVMGFTLLSLGVLLLLISFKA